jgi:hypothetical protein
MGTRGAVPGTKKIFLLSPASASGERAKLVLNPHARFDLATRLRGNGAPLGEVFAFVSGLYFRGKLAYSEAFADPPRRVPPSLVITPGRGLVPPSTVVTLADMLEMASVPIDTSEQRYMEPLARDANLLAQAAGEKCQVVLLGSVASDKYVAPLIEVFGQRLLFPSDFVGRGDMSRGGLMLRCARSRIELPYVPVINAVRHGPRPPRLPRLTPSERQQS